VGFLLDKVALGQVFLRVLRFPLPILIAPTVPRSPFTIIRGWYNRPTSGRRTDWTQCQHTQRIKRRGGRRRGRRKEKNKEKEEKEEEEEEKKKKREEEEEEKRAGWRNLHMSELHNLHFSPNNIGMINSKRTRRANITNASEK
jgi:hypothetical protein